MVDDPAAAQKLGRLVKAAVADVESRSEHLPPSVADRLLAALLSEDADAGVSHLLMTLAEESPVPRSSQP